MGKSEVETALRLDVRALQRGGCLRDGAVFLWGWKRGDEPSGSINAMTRGDGVMLRYSYAGESVTQRVGVEWTRCNYGGRRAWWRCPACARRVALLYAAGKYFACRHCYRLCYAVQLEQTGDRLLRAAWKIRRGLGQREGGHFCPLPDKPKGMHWKTYDLLCWRCEVVEARDFAALMVRFGGRE